jgi:hypothetical protein
MGLAFGLAGFALACGDDPSPSNDTADADGGVDATPAPLGDATPTPNDANGNTDVTVIPGTDAGVDAEAGAVITSILGSNGFIKIFDEVVQADFYEDDTIIRATDGPDCVAYVRSETKPRSSAGSITVGGGIVGQDGGPDAAIIVEPGQENYYALVAPVFAPSTAVQVQVSKSATSSLAELPVVTLQTPGQPKVVVTQPTPPDGGADLVIETAEALEVKWTPPSNPGNLRFIMYFNDLLAPGKKGDIACHFPLSAGKGTIPASLLKELRARFGQNISGFAYYGVGDAKEVVIGNTSYFIVVTRVVDATNVEYLSVILH